MKRRRRPYWRDIRTHWYWIAFAALLIAQWLMLPPLAPRPTGPESLEEGIHEVRRVVDGDTLLLESGARVRLEGVDTPETVRENHPVEPWGPEASQYTKDFVREAGGRVRLTFGNERVDDYGRFLAFVWHGDRLLNEELVRAGLARAQLQWRYSTTMKRRFRLAEDEARAAQRGIWSAPAATPEPAVPVIQ
jgi:micrococcal nuclease